MAETTWQWMTHPDVTNPARIPARAVQAWQARGWRTTDPPPDLDPALADREPAPDTAGTPGTSGVPAPRLATSQRIPAESTRTTTAPATPSAPSGTGTASTTNAEE